MKKIICAVFDVKSEFYGNPFTAVNTQSAVREFAAAVNDPTAMLYKYPEDFRLLKLAEYDDTTGAVEGLVNPEVLIDAISCKEHKNV